MFRSMSRVAVVAIVVLAFAVASLPAYAAPHGGGKATAQAESGWFESAVAWLSQMIFGDGLKSKTASSMKKLIYPDNGSCIDPFGGCG